MESQHSSSMCHMLSHFSRVPLSVTLWTAACQAALSMGFSMQEYWSGLPCFPQIDVYLCVCVCVCVCVYLYTCATPVLLPGKSHGWRSLVGSSPWGREESDMTEHFTLTFCFHALEKEMATTPVSLPRESQGQGSLVGCHLWGCIVGHD